MSPGRGPVVGLVPLGLCLAAAGGHAVALAGGGAAWQAAAAYALAAGVVGGFLATLPDLARPLEDGRPETARAWLSLAAVALGLVNLSLEHAATGGLSLLLSAAASVLIALGARAGGPHAPALQAAAASMRRRYVSSTTGQR